MAYVLSSALDNACFELAVRLFYFDLKNLHYHNTSNSSSTDLALHFYNIIHLAIGLITKMTCTSVLSRGFDSACFVLALFFILSLGGALKEVKCYCSSTLNKRSYVAMHITNYRLNRRTANSKRAL
jgi:hypothetical protein